MSLVAAIVAAAIIAGCASSTDANGAGADVRGTWQYSAFQTGPTAASLTGTLVIAERSGASFSGSVNASETDSRGIIYTRIGTLAGQAGVASADFDVFFEPNGRRHVARLTADTLAGNWVQATSSSTPLSGTFRAVRTSRP